MSEVVVNHAQARKALDQAWAKIDTGLMPPPVLLYLIRQVLLARDVAFKYIMVTGILGKLTNPEIHPRALQVKSTLPGAYDARSLCHKVLVPFEKDRQLNLFGLSNEPLVGKPARHPEHHKSNAQLKNKRLAAIVHEVLERARIAAPAEVEAMLVGALRVGREIGNTRVVPATDFETNLRHVLTFAHEFLREGDGGARLVAVTGAFVSLLSESYDVRTYPPSAPDQFSGTVGDVEVSAGGTVCSGYECKHRPLNLDDVRHGIRKARERGVPEYVFVTAEGLARGQEDSVRAEIEGVLDSLDVSLLDIRDAARFWAAALNPARRAKFGQRVATILRKDMRRHDAANIAAELWNSLEQ